MFDDQVPPPSTQQEPQDIFSETSSGSAAAAQAPAPSAQPSPSTQQFQPGGSEHHQGFNPKLILIIVAILALLVVAAFGIQFMLRSQQKPQANEQQQAPAQQAPIESQNQPRSAPAVQKTPDQAQQIAPPQTAPGVALPTSVPVLPEVQQNTALSDTDTDGLGNDEELKIATDPQNPDTDSDGLSDGDEVKTFKTNPLVADTDTDGLSDTVEVKTYTSDPLNPDTDADGYLDGAEVTNGYNPTGAGSLQK